MSNHLTDKSIIITGAGSGFGRLVAQKTAARGAKVVVADIREAGLAETAELIRKDGGTVEEVLADVTDRTQMNALAARTIERFEAIDIVINNAGVMPLALYEDHAAAAEAWDRCIDINLKGVLHGIACVYDQMIRQGRGHIVNISSIYGNYPVTGAAVYGATKAAVAFLSESLRQETQGRIKVTTVRPTGVPGTGLAEGIVNPAAIQGVLGAGAAAFMETMGQALGDDPPRELVDPDQIEYFALAPELLADQILYAIDQPWGVSISDLTVRASGDRYMI